ncbi:hypothetical protein [Arcobacter porcinus]|uniref:Uncharacterized protein n=1 Tax=Arcobacter porcinus TaxID=1935204 RepID=A0A5C2HCE0_9BACT|nr:hypothetical protein [Arcobacter porcinus]OCL96786.1 hypothetical protein AAX27_00418 [Aliarcobacter thereius]QEP40616.1 hypothetical protein APORC_1014 [Arcobacter porcinus]
MRNFFLIGQIKGAKATSRTDKATGVQIHSTDVIVQFEDYDKNGDLVLDTDTISFKIEDLEQFKLNRQKYISIPYIFLNTKNGSYMFPDENMKYQIYDTYPLLNKNDKQDKKIA